jgi:hypothetical protein
MDPSCNKRNHLDFAYVWANHLGICISTSQEEFLTLVDHKSCSFLFEMLPKDAGYKESLLHGWAWIIALDKKKQWVLISATKSLVVTPQRLASFVSAVQRRDYEELSTFCAGSSTWNKQYCYELLMSRNLPKSSKL